MTDIFQLIDDKPVMILLIGPPACGKSTWRAQYMARREEKNALLSQMANMFNTKPPAHNARRTTVVSSDDIVEEYAAERGISYDEAFYAMPFKDIEKAMKARMAEALVRHDDIIVDRTNMSVGSRNKSLARARQARVYKTIGIVFEVDEETLDQRRKDRFIATGKSVPQSELDNMKARYEAPTRAEFDHCFVVRQ